MRRLFTEKLFRLKNISWFEGEAAEEFVEGLPFFAFALEFEDGDEAVAGGDEDAFFFVAGYDLAGLGAFGRDVADWEFVEGVGAPDYEALAV